jgi:protein-S-isoprenylcysteine O-methyltransferase Ste14
MRTRRVFWTAAAFYTVIGFEFLYMAGPFAAYFYSVYGPGLNFFNESPTFSWLARFFLPHIVSETSSFFINSHNMAGALLAVFGFLAFCAGAGQVYFHKLAKKGPVMGGVYRIIRHPQYASFAVCGFGLLLLWPRFIVLVMYVTMLFGYYLLAKAEERECEEKYGKSYLEYKRTTRMFLPFKAPLVGRLPHLPESGWKRRAAVAILYVVTLAAGVIAAELLESHSLKSLYTYSSSDSVTVSVVKMSPEALETLVKTALASENVQMRLEKQGKGARFLNYVLPAEWFISEIPMESHEGSYHLQPGDYNRSLYKIIFTMADMRGAANAEPREFLRRVTRRTPVAEVWVDVVQARVIEVKEPPSDIKYENIPVAIY